MNDTIQKKTNINIHANEVLALDDDKIKEYLLNTPEFFVKYPDLLETLRLPHEQKGSVSLFQMQSDQLRQKILRLNAKLAEFVAMAMSNESIFKIYAKLNLKLIQCESLEEIEHCITTTVNNELHLSSACIKWFSGKDVLPEIQQRLFLDKRFNNTDYFFGRLSDNEKQLLFKTDEVNSVALVLLGTHEKFGFMAIGSDNAMHFTPDMNTMLLSLLKEFMEQLVPPLLTK